MRVAVLACLCIAVVGCATRSTTVDHRILLPEAGSRYSVEPAQFFVMPLALVSPEPAFPVSGSTAEPGDVVVCAEIWLSEDGVVTRIAPFRDSGECAGETRRSTALAYEQAVVEALRHWEFTPAMICEFPPQSLGKRARGDCRGPEVVVRRVPVRLNYAFTFSSREGKRRVGIARKTSHDDVSGASGTR